MLKYNKKYVLTKKKVWQDWLLITFQEHRSRFYSRLDERRTMRTPSWAPSGTSSPSATTGVTWPTRTTGDYSKQFFWNFWTEVSISSTFYKPLFCTKVLCSAFLLLWFCFVILWHTNIGKKAAFKMLMKLTIGVASQSAHPISETG